MVVANLWFRHVFTKTSTFLTKREQRVKINGVYSTRTEILFGVTQSSILGTLLFIIFLCEFFMVVPNYDIANHADDTATLLIQLGKMCKTFL